MKCSKCGFEVKSNLKFCPACGASLSQPAKQKTLFWIPGENNSPFANLSQTPVEKSVSFEQNHPSQPSLDASQPIELKTPSSGLAVNSISPPTLPISSSQVQNYQNNSVANYSNSPKPPDNDVYDFNKPIIFNSEIKQSYTKVIVGIILLVSLILSFIFIFKDSIF